MKEWAKPDSPGCAVAAIRDGRSCTRRGTAWPTSSVPIVPETVFDIASTSKQLTAAAILLLAAQ
jgi:CubicO group peptidase (beta-lactamase class C family)